MRQAMAVLWGGGSWMRDARKGSKVLSIPSAASEEHMLEQR